MAGVPPKKGEALSFTIPGLVEVADTDNFKANPTLAAGDVKVFKDGGSGVNIGTLPTAIDAGTELRITLSIAEMTADDVLVSFKDVAGDEWQSEGILVFTDTAQMGELDDGAITAAKIAADAIGASELAADAVAEIQAGLLTLGAGTTPLEVTVTDGVNPLDGAEVDVTTTAAHIGPVASGYTDAFGKVTFHLDPGTYYIWVQHSGYNGPNPTAKVIA